MQKHDCPRKGLQDTTPVGSGGEVPRGLMCSGKRAKEKLQPSKISQRVKGGIDRYAMISALGGDELFEVLIS